MKEFDSGMVRDDVTGKVMWHLIMDGPMLRRYAERMTMGAEKYGERNWLKANGNEERERFRESAFRHFMQWYNGEVDEDHAAAVIFNMNGKEYVDERLAEKSRWEVGTGAAADSGGGEGRSPEDRESTETTEDWVDRLRGRDCHICNVGGLHYLEQRTDREDGYTRRDPDLYGGRWYESSLD